jgi:hypothetical protein
MLVVVAGQDVTGIQAPVPDDAAVQARLWRIGGNIENG